LDVGLVGIECYYAQYSDHQQRELVELAKQYGLIQTGGSDFHGLNRMGHMSALGQVDVPIEVVDKLKQAKKKIK
jgi:predicted metal-dependent phosphoesterase TrpH